MKEMLVSSLQALADIVKCGKRILSNSQINLGQKSNRRIDLLTDTDPIESHRQISSWPSFLSQASFK